MTGPIKKFSCPHCDKEHAILTSKCPETGDPISIIYKLQGRVVGGKYEVGKRIAEGGMGIVYEGRHRDIGKRVAIKFLFPEMKASEEVLSRFQNEARIAASIAHKNIVDVFDVGSTHDGVPFIIMEYLEGNSLGDIMQLGTVSEQMAIEICIEILSALNAVHSKGIIHRDLKPDNTFVMEQSGGDQIVKLLDFGISYLSGPMELEGKELLKTKTGIIIGTPKYMSPEQARGSKTLDARADLYAVGVMLYQMVTGKLPFDAENYNSLIIAITSEEPIPPRFYRPELSTVLEDIILKAIEKDPNRRFQSAAEFAAHLMILKGFEASVPSFVAAIPDDVMQKIRNSIPPELRGRQLTPSVEILTSDIAKRRLTPSIGSFSKAKGQARSPSQRPSNGTPGDRSTSYPSISFSDRSRTPSPVTGTPPPDMQRSFSPFPFVSEEIALERTLPGKTPSEPPSFIPVTPRSTSYAPPAAAEKKTRWMVPVLVVGLSILAGAAAISIAVRGGLFGKEKAGPAAPGEPVRVVETKSQGAVEAPRWKVTIEGLPGGASVYVDGDLHPERPLVLDERPSARRIAVEAPGYERWEKSVAVHSDISLSLEMSPAGPPEETAGEPQKTAKAKKKKQEAPREPQEEEAKTQTKKKIDITYPGLKK
jgi:serine/threonine protein kinase